MTLVTASRSPQQAAITVIGVSLVFHLVLAATLGLGVDECYGVSVAHDLKLSYFDHPPLNYWIAHTFMPLLGDGRAARLPFIAMFAATTWALYLLTRQLFGAAAGFWAVLALNLSAFFTLAGGWILPDGPLMLGLVAAAYTLSRGLFPDAAPPSPWRTWLAAGFWIGFAALSKYHAVLFVAGLFIYIVTVPSRRALLRHPASWAGAIIALVMASPVVIWNAQHDWVSFAYHTGRASGGGFPHLERMLANIGGQLVWLLPWIFVPLVIASYRALRAGREAEQSWYCLCLGMPTVAIFTVIPLWGEVGLPHWQMPGWLMLYPVLGDYVAREAAMRARPRRWAIASAVAMVVLVFVIVGHASTGYLRLLFPQAFAYGDPTLEAFEWTALRGELEARGLLDRKGLFIVTRGPIEAGKIDQALNDRLPIQIFGERKQYAFRYDPASFLGRDALVIAPGNRMQRIDAELGGYFESIEELPPFAFGRSGMREVELRILYARGLKKPLL